MDFLINVITLRVNKCLTIYQYETIPSAKIAVATLPGAHHRNIWFRWHVLQCWRQTRQFVLRGKRIKKALNLEEPVLTKCKLITAIVRNDRFCDGALIQAFECGLMLRIIKTIKKQVESSCLSLPKGV
jgi:hypothetical protein